MSMSAGVAADADGAAALLLFSFMPSCGQQCARRFHLLSPFQLRQMGDLNEFSISDMRALILGCEAE